MSLEIIQDSENKYYFKTKSGHQIEIELKNNEPNVVLGKWNRECFIKFPIQFAKFSEYKKGKNELIWENNKFKIKLYPVDTKTYTELIAGEEKRFKQNEDGALEWEITIKKKPPKNSFSIPIKTQNLKFYFQPPLHPDHPTWADTNRDGKADLFRPENVVGSYAVYHARKGNMYRSKEEAEKYKTGKVFHIYRPKVVDADGNEAWCDLNIDETKKILTITIPQTFLDNATYPIIVDPTFGYTGEGASTQTPMDRITGSVFTISESGTASEMSAYLRAYYDNPLIGWTSVTMKVAIYKHSDSTLIAASSDTSVYHASAAWQSFDISGNLEANTEYVLVLWGKKPYTIGDFYYDSGDVNQGHYQEETYNGFPDPASFTHEDRKYSIYCTYTAGGPTYVNVQISFLNFILFYKIIQSSLNWSIRKGISKILTSLHIIRNLVIKILVMVFVFLELIKKIFKIPFSLRSIISNVLYILESNAKYISKILKTTFGIASFIFTYLESSYMILKRVSKRISFLFNSLNFRFRDLNIVNYIQVFISSILDFFYNLRTLSSKILSINWKIKAFIEYNISLLFSLSGLIKRELISVYKLLVLRRKEFIFKNSILNRLYNSLILIANLRKYISKILISIFNLKIFVPKIIGLKYKTKISIHRIFSFKFGIIAFIERIISFVHSFLGFYIEEVTCTPFKVHRVEVESWSLRCDWHDEDDLAIDKYKCQFWVRDESNNIYGPYTGSITKEGTKEYYATYELDPDATFLLGLYDIKVEVTKYA